MENAKRALPRYPVVFVLGIAHSGSTLLGKLLDMHSRVLCVGELLRIKDAMQKGYPCSCGNRVEECSFWHKHIEWMQKDNDLDYRYFGHEFYAKLCSLSNKDVAIDLSKTRVIRMMAGFFGYKKKKFKEAGFILLLRDPRGVGASAMRRTEKSLDQFLKGYLKWMNRFQKLADRESQRLHIMKYEDLCNQPEQEIKRLCRFIGIDFEPQMMTPSEKPHHLVHSSTSNYMKNLNALVVDERWRHELTREQIEKIERIINKVNLLRDAFVEN